MSKRLYFILPVLVFAAVFGMYVTTEVNTSNISDLRKTHEEFLKENAPEKDKGFSRLEKIQKGLPPNQYYELMEYLTMNPALGYPEPYKVRELHERLQQQRRSKANQKSPGDSEKHMWTSRGPNNVGGRTRVLMFDPNDENGRRVFAGAISGGLWVNDNITSVSSPWRKVEGLPANLNISCLTVDPRDSNIWYAGTGEQYTGGDVVGTGVYKTTDAGETWTRVLDVEDFSDSTSGSNIRAIGGVFYINDIQAWDNGSSTEVFIGVSTHLYANARNPLNLLGFYEKGLYGTKDGGSNWTKLVGDESFNDFEVDASGHLWVATTYSPGVENSRGGNIYKREKGTSTSFMQITTIPNVYRTEIEASATNPEKFYILAEGLSEEAEMWITTDAFANISSLNEPNDADLDIPAQDFARGQAFYNLMIESDPTDDNIVYAGGIDLFRSTNSGQSWEQISKWANNDNLNELQVSLVHADHHVMQFRPGNTNQAIFGHDGGVSYSRDLAAASTSDVFITPETNYITTQFYSIAVAPSSFASGDYFLGGTQDNGTQLIQNGNPVAIGVLGGDGAHAFYDQDDTQYFISNLVYNDLIVLYDYDSEGYALIANNEDRDGFFINPQALDSQLDKLYSNGPEGTLYRYDNLTSLTAIGDDGITGNDPVATRRSLKNALLGTSISAINVSPYTTSSSTVLLGLINGKLLRVQNADGDPANANWKDITGSQFVGSISDVEFGRNEDEIYVTFYNYGVRSIWYTANATSANPTWVNKEGDLPDLPVLAILPNPLNPQEVIVGTELGVWASENFLSSSPTWKQSYNGMSDVKVTDLDLKKGNNMVYAASYGRGMFSGVFKTAEQEAEERGEVVIDDETLNVYPTVSNGTYNIVSGATTGVEIYVYSISGKLVQVITTQLDANISEPFYLSTEASGIYILRVVTPGGTTIHKLIKK
ncbi:T9SS type A sorting domain-containing protein [Salinimicrobium oceani]|uniref:T9SS type A sorting domain-containing protein n=1 Tax=Salinimicrobium oceani TaxID=2722702 RepID=A0ABX1CZW3_9FLAO|nr:T9SS type A sorting domain-containing protein [Salinimicrobium oceani]NJW52141.1 T9SS type A sorting domain-containing protein [Salinimicrobium oceani]